jgi:hypothetical protein
MEESKDGRNNINWEIEVKKKEKNNKISIIFHPLPRSVVVHKNSLGTSFRLKTLYECIGNPWED